MKAAPEAQKRLLDLQAVDTTISQIKHKRRQLPEHSLIATAQSERAALGSELIAAKTRVADLELEQAKSESDLIPVRERKARDQRRVDDGSITDPKSLRALLDEIEHLGHRIAELEDNELEIMEWLETSQAALDDLLARRASGDDALRALIGTRDARLAELDAELLLSASERDAIAALIPSDLLVLYAKVSERAGGTGAALLQHGRCGGCQLAATAADLKAYHAAADDDVVRCVECDRILVRTAESG